MDNNDSKLGGSGNWTLYYTDDGIPYWHDHTTGESIWANKEGIL